MGIIPQHLKRFVMEMRKIALEYEYLKGVEFKGTDASLRESLFEYGLIIGEQGDTVFVVYRYGYDDYLDDSFTRDYFEDLLKEDWIEWDSLLSTFGMTKTEWDELPLVHKLSDLMGHYSIEDVFGMNYYSTFRTEEEMELLIQWIENEYQLD